MEVRENSGREFDGDFETPIYQEDMHDEEECSPQLNSNKNRQQVFMFNMTPGRHDRLAALSLVILAAVLLIVDISLGVHYSKLRDTHLTADDAERIEKELKELHDTYKTAIKTMKDSRQELDNEMTRQTPSTWELEHQQKRKSANEEQIDQMTVAIASMKSQLPILRDSCRLCPIGWVLMNSVCYYFAFSNVDGTKSWKRAREFCQEDGGDLVIMDSKDKVNLTVNALRNYYKDSKSPNYFWIGLQNIHEEGTWKWLDGTSLAEGYWDDGEPADFSMDSCAKVYPTQNFFKSWSSALCEGKKKWICEKAPIVIS